MAIDKTKLIERVRSIKGLTDDERAALLGMLRERKSYGLVWEDKPEDVEERLRTELPVLKEVKNLAIVRDNADAPNHILIEGDNLEALTTLAYTHEGKIDVIYIDPPYNTGNKDFVYNDSFVDREDGYRHSKWLSFMAKRLRIAKRLLSDRGVIFISIDDNEQAQLKLLCDEIFGEQNFISQIIWHSKYTTSNDAKDISRQHDYVIVYCKSQDYVAFGLLPRSEEMNAAYRNKDKDPKGPWKATPLHARSGSKDAIYTITFPNGTSWTPPKGRFPTYSKETLMALYEDGRLYFNSKGGVDKKTYLSEVKGGKTAGSVWRYDEVGSTHQANEQLADVLGKGVFTSPKSIGLIQRALIIGGAKDANILDFFAGSGTTLHATMQLNAEDGGKRQCILVTNNENGICENVTYERNKRVIKGYTTPKGVKVEGLHNNNLRYYRTDFVNRRRTPQNMRRLMLLASDMLCIKENLYTEHDDFAGVETLKNGFRYFANDDKQMLIIYDETAIYTIVELLENLELAQPIVTYVFSPANDPWEAEFEEVADKVRLTALPAAIYNAYKRVLPKPKDELTEKKPETVSAKQEQGTLDFGEEGGEQ